MLLSFKADVFERVKSGEKIYEHRRVFPDEPVKAYLYISTPVKAIVGIMRLDNKYIAHPQYLWMPIINLLIMEQAPFFGG